MPFQPTLARIIAIVFALLSLAGCAAIPASLAPTSDVPQSRDVPPTSAPEATAELRRTPTRVPTPAPVLRPYNGPFELEVAEPDPRCKQSSPFDLPASGLETLAFVPTSVCGSGELGLFEIDGRRYLVQAAFGPTTFILLDITDPTRPSQVGAWRWNPVGITYDVKPFRQGQRHFLALSLETARRPGLDPCGVAIVEVTNPQQPELLGRYDGANVGSEAAWCNVHTSSIDTDADGNATFLMASVRDTFDLRVLDIRDLENIREVGAYHLHDHPHASPPDFQGSFLHDSTIAGDRVYVAYWGAGVMILDKKRLEAGEPPEAVALNPPRSIASDGFNAHHAYPTADGQFLFVEAEDRADDAVKLFDIRDPARPRELLTINLDDGLSPPHNLLVRDNLLFVGWYNEGVRVFRFDLSDPAKPLVEPLAFQAVRDDPSANFYDGIWGVRVDSCQVAQRERLCVYASDMSLGVLIMALEKN